uniref:Uncharacterized protein n=1 Tax=Oryza rufipogon TaxID=4529 RepID=A0A0E0R8Z1_ORYRU
MDAATTSGRAVDCDPVPVRDEGYVDALVRASLHLIRKDFPHEVRGHGVRLLQHLMRFRWEEVSIINWSKFADVFSLLGVELGVLDDLVWKNAAADLVAEVVWSHGISLLHDLIPCLVCLSAKRATETELVCFILKSISDNRIAHVSHFGVQLTGKLTPLVLIGDKGELLSLSEFLPQILPFISSLLEKHVGAVLGEKEKCQVEVAEEHASVVKAVLDAAITYAGWAHVVDLGKHGLIKGCGCLLSCNDFCVHALQFFKLILQRKRPVSIAVADHDFADYLLCPHTTFHYVQALHGALSISASPKDYCSSSSSYSNISGTVSQNTSVQKRLSCESSSNNKSSTAVGNDGARRSNSFHHVGCLLLAEQNLISEAFLIYLQCVHALWNREITFDLSKKLAKAKRFGIDEEEGFQEIEMRQWLQDIRESGYLLLNDCLGRLRMSLFGYLVDGEAATKAIPFCRALIHLAGAANDDKLRDLVKEQKEIEDAADSFTCWLFEDEFEDIFQLDCQILEIDEVITDVSLSTANKRHVAITKSSKSKSKSPALCIKPSPPPA